MGKLFRLVLIYPDGSIHPGGDYISREELEVTLRAVARALAGENKQHEELPREYGEINQVVPIRVGMTLDGAEKLLITATLRRTDGNISESAVILAGHGKTPIADIAVSLSRLFQAI